MSERNRLNLNGEFLGVTSLAVFSAPWFLQPPLTILVGLMFIFKVLDDAKEYRNELETSPAKAEDEDLEEAIEEVSRVFFGITVAQEDLPVYWMGTLLFAITLIYSIGHFVQRLANYL